MKTRLQEGNSWFPYPCLFSFGLVLLFSGHILLGINPRIGNPADVLPFEAEIAKEGAIWLSISVQKGHVFVSTDDRHVFSWNEQNRNLDVIEPLVKHLRNRLVQITLSASLAKEISHTESLVVLAVDQSLKYLHIQPILIALAQVGVSEYAFETRQPAS
ncbi:MAG: hypothetical protein AB8G05_09395 [Oligoflexales bacterium]